MTHLNTLTTRVRDIDSKRHRCLYIGSTSKLRSCLGGASRSFCTPIFVIGKELRATILPDELAVVVWFRGWIDRKRHCFDSHGSSIRHPFDVSYRFSFSLSLSSSFHYHRHQITVLKPILALPCIPSASTWHRARTCHLP